MAGMNQYRRFAEDLNRLIFIGSGHGNAQDGVPSTLELQTLGRFLPGQLEIKFRKIGAETVEEQGLDILSLMQ